MPLFDWEGGVDADFLIIGGGIAGVSAAAELSGLGSVLLLEQEAVLAHHASSRSAALYEPHYGAAPVVALSLLTGPVLEGIAGVLSPRGVMMVGRADQAAAFQHDADAMQMTRMSVDEAVARVPVLNRDVVTMAAGADHAQDIDTDLLLQHFARVARGNGARIELRAGVTAIARDGAGWRVSTAQGAFGAPFVVNAAGPWADVVAGMAGVAPRGLTPMRRSMARIPAPGGHDVSRWPMLFGPGEDWYAKPDAGALIVSPAEEHPMPPHDAFADDMVLAEGLARYEAMVTEPVTRVLANWAGLRTFAPDRVPVIGPDTATHAFLWLAGQGGYGFQSCAGAARLLGDLVAGRAPEIGADMAARLSPARFR
ncbi:MAG: NAD(P)/FAD-dependent oxidoreductase [Paracoccaceae bacterium]